MFHALIIFLILMVGFISFAKRTLLDNYILDAVDKNVAPMVDKLDDNTKRTLSIISTIFPFHKLKKQYEKPNELAEEKFKWLHFSTIMMTVYSIAFAVIIVFTLLYTCGQCIPLKNILIENIITLVIVGIVVYFFFVNNMIEYLTPSPDFIMNAMGRRLRSNLKV
jgi:hypothetical protein